MTFDDDIIALVGKFRDIVRARAVSAVTASDFSAAPKAILPLVPGEMLRVRRRGASVRRRGGAVLGLLCCVSRLATTGHHDGPDVVVR